LLPTVVPVNLSEAALAKYESIAEDPTTIYNVAALDN
jgi:hypothetical protein